MKKGRTEKEEKQADLRTGERIGEQEVDREIKKENKKKRGVREKGVKQGG